VNGAQAQRPIRLVLIVIGGIAAGVILAASMVGAQDFQLGGMGPGQDSHAYWLASRDMRYEAPAGTFGAYLYSPAFVQILSPILGVGWPQFVGLWTAMLIGALLKLSGPVLFAVALPLTFFELWGGNIHLLLALSIVVGFRHPSAWAFVLLTKVTPGVGLLWFAARREWTKLGMAIGATAAVFGLSWLVDPGAWQGWADLLLRQAGSAPPPGSIAIPLALRVPIAAIVIVYAAKHDQRWLLPVGVLLAMPVLWWGSLSILIASVGLEKPRLERALTTALRARFSMARVLRPAPIVPELTAEGPG